MSSSTPALPIPGVGALGAAARRTRLRRRCLTLALAATITAAALVASRASWTSGAPPAPVTSGGVIVLDMSGSMQHDSQGAIRKSLKALDRGLPPDGRMGVVVFSDTGGIMLPATAPRSAVRRLLRFYPTHRARSRVAANELYRYATPHSPWDGTFIGGTLLSTGILSGEAALQRAGMRGGSLYLISDLADDTADGPVIEKLVDRLRREHITLTLLRVPGDTPSRFFSRLDPRVVSFAKPKDLRRLPIQLIRTPVRASHDQKPIALAALVVVIALLLAATELVFPRLRFRREEVG